MSVDFDVRKLERHVDSVEKFALQGRAAEKISERGVEAEAELLNILRIDALIFLRIRCNSEVGREIARDRDA